VAESLFGIDRRRQVPRFARRTLAQRAARTGEAPDVVLFADTFTNHYEPEIGLAVLDLLAAAGVRASVAEHGCCGRPQISKGLLGDARSLAARNADALFDHAAAGRTILFCEPSCLSAVREDAPALLRGEERRRAETVANACMLFEPFMNTIADRLALKSGPAQILLHGHCHQKSMGLVAPAKALLSRIPDATVVDLDAGCCGMAGSFGYTREHFDVSRTIAERRLLPAVRQMPPDAVLVASGMSCRHQVADFTGVRALHAAELLGSLLS
jgi:Fe-S oxidoreductase